MLFLVACAGTRIIPISEDVQLEVQEVIESKHYNVSFYQTYLKDLSNNYLRSSGDLYVSGDSLGYCGERGMKREYFAWRGCLGKRMKSRGATILSGGWI